VSPSARPRVASRPVSTRTAVRLVLVALLTTLAVALAAWLVYRLQTIVVWGVLALFIAVALNPAVNWLARRRVPRTLAILVMYAVVCIILAAIGALAVPPLAEQARQLIHVLQQPGGLAAELEKAARPLGLGGLVKSVRPQLDALPGQIASSVGSLPTVTATTASSITAVLSVGVLAFFLIHDGAYLLDATVRLAPDAHRPRIRRVLDRSADASNLLISGIAGASALVGMLALGIPYALPLAVLLAVVDLIPMVGATLGAIPVVLAALTVSPVKALIMVAYVIVYSNIESNVLNPLIYGRTDQLPAAVVFVAFLVGSALWGILGALVAIPAANIIRILIREWSGGAPPREAVPTSNGGRASLTVVLQREHTLATGRVRKWRRPGRQ
jgi:predicted PurR-regulated permease PerM